MSKYTNATVSLKLPFSHNVHFSSTSVVSTITQLHRRSKGGYLGKYLVGQILFLNIGQPQPVFGLVLRLVLRLGICLCTTLLRKLAIFYKPLPRAKESANFLQIPDEKVRFTSLGSMYERVFVDVCVGGHVFMNECGCVSEWV